MAEQQVSETFDPKAWQTVPGFEFTDITYHRAVDVGAVRIAFHRPEIRNAFRPHTVDELYTALDHARQSSDVGCVLLTGNGPSPKDGGWAFCSGGDQRIRGRTGYQYTVVDAASGRAGETAETVEPGRAGRLHILECQRLIRFMPKVVIAVVNGWAAGGGHSLHAVADLTLASAEHARFKQTDSDVGSFDGGYGSASTGRLHILEVQRLIRFMPKIVICVVPGWAAGGGHSLHVTCDLTLASREHARFKQTDADVGSFDGGYGSAYLAKQVGQKFAREVFFLGRPYTAEQMHHMGAVNEVVDHADLERVGIQWAREINAKSPQAQRMLKFAFNLLDDGLVGQQLFAGEATRLAYMTDEAVEGRDAFLEKRDPDWSRFPRYF